MKNKFHLFHLIFQYWYHWITLPVDVITYTDDWESWEGIAYYDGYNMTFWYALNHDWYKMNNRMYAKTGVKDPYQEPNDFIDYYYEN